MSGNLLVKRLSPTARLPERAEPGSVGYDLRADLTCEAEILMPGERIAVPTGLAISVPPGTYGRIAPRSGLAAAHGIGVLAGVVDPSYRGEVRIVLVNHGPAPVTVLNGLRVAQLILERAETPGVVEVDALGETARGAGGFGSTGAA